DAARVRRAGADAGRLRRLLPGQRAAGVDAVGREGVAGDVRAAREPPPDPERRRARVGRRVAAARDRRRLDPARARRVQGGRAIREEARQAEAVGMTVDRFAGRVAERYDDDYETGSAGA